MIYILGKSRQQKLLVFVSTKTESYPILNLFKKGFKATINMFAEVKELKKKGLDSKFLESEMKEGPLLLTVSK